jgi:hypothetical protein
MDRSVHGSNKSKNEGVTFRNGKGKWQTVVAKKVEPKRRGEQLLFFGMH